MSAPSTSGLSVIKVTDYELLTLNMVALLYFGYQLIYHNDLIWNPIASSDAKLETDWVYN